MFKETFLSHRPSQFRVNRLVKSFIASEVLVWSSWNCVMPVIAVFATNNIRGGDISIAATALSGHLMVRVAVELFIGKVLSHLTESRKFLAVISGIMLVSLSYIGFAFTRSTTSFFVFYALSGLGLGIATPLKNSLFSTHLDRSKETMEWGLYDALVFMGMAASAAAGGVIAKTYGFSVIFWLAALVNLLGIIPYFLYAQSRLKKLIFGQEMQTGTHV